MSKDNSAPSPLGLAVYDEAGALLMARGVAGLPAVQAALAEPG